MKYLIKTYSNENDIVLVFTKTITINNDTYSMIQKFKNTTELFENFPKNNLFSILTQPSIMMRGTDEIYIDCNPTGVSDDTIATYNVPINSEYTKDSGKITLMKTAIQLSLVAIFLVVVYLTFPTAYKAIVINNVNKFILENNQMNDEKYKDETGGIDTFVRIQSADILLFCYAFLICCLLYVESSITGNDSYQTSVIALYLFIIVALAYASISTKKESVAFMQTKIKIGEVDGFTYPAEKDMLEGTATSYFPYIMIDDVWSLLMISLNYAFTGYAKYNRIIILVISFVWLSIRMISITPLTLQWVGCFLVICLVI
jgi:hypothetical protein